MTNLGAGFSMGSPENPGSQPQSSSSPSCERDRCADFTQDVVQVNNIHRSVRTVHSLPLFVFSSKQLMPPPPLAVNGARPKVEERKAPQGPAGKGVILWIDKSLPKSKSRTVTLL